MTQNYLKHKLRIIIKVTKIFQLEGMEMDNDL